MTRRRGSVLLVDDEDKLRKSLGRALRGDGHEVVDAEDARLALHLLGERVFDVLLVDNMMPGMTGLDLIREIVATRETGAPGVVDPQPQIVMMTAHATVESAIEAMKLGAIDYLQKPFEIDELLVTIRRALDHQRLRTDYSYLRSERDEQFDHYGIVGCSHAMQGVIARIELVARTKSTILISGETGTGKELVARAIHDRSAQREMPLVKVNCAAIPETVLESELFGHVRGAFTDAIATKKGKFALAALRLYDWPGNVRELENAVERAVVLSTGPIVTAAAMPMAAAPIPRSIGLPSLMLRRNLEWVERDTIRLALDRAAASGRTRPR